MSERRVGIIGTAQSGKTTMIGLLDLATAETASKDSSFTATINEQQSNVYDVADGMCQGHFPPRTPIGQFYEADFVFHKRMGGFGPIASVKRLRLPIVETAGEDLAKLIESHTKGLYKVNPRAKYDAWQLYQHILQSIGFIMIAPCTEIRGLEQFDVTQDERMLYNADTNITRLLSTIIEYKEYTKAPPIEGLALLFTKYDMVMGFLAGEGLDLTHQDERLRRINTKRFLEKYMRNTNRLLNFYDSLKDTICIPSWVDLEYDPKTAEPMRHDDNSAMIKILNTGLPKYSGFYYGKLINWICDTFMR